MTKRWLAALLLGLALPCATAQGLELGFGGEVVAERWNPLRLTLRDTPGATLHLVIDQGSLRGGELLAEISLELPATSGLRLLEHDLYIPAWRSLVWRVITPERVLASGALDRRSLDRRALTLLVSSAPGRWLERLGEGERAVAQPSALLPERLAAYDGVSRLIVDGTTAAPSAAALAAASSAGATVVLVEPLPASYAPLLALAPRPAQRLGAGYIVRLEGPEVSREQLARLPSATPVAELRAALGGALPPHMPLAGLPLFALGALYSLAIILLLRFAGLPGLLGSLLLAPLVSLSAWSLARPGAQLLERSSTLVLAGGALAREDLASSLLSLPARALELSANARPDAPTRYRQTWDELELQLGRWQALRLEHRPSLLRAAFTWDGGDLVNRGSSELREVTVLGLGPQGALEPGARLLPRAQEEGPLPDDYARLAAALPPRSALARDGSAVLVALPDVGLEGYLP